MKCSVGNEQMNTENADAVENEMRSTEAAKSIKESRNGLKCCS